MSVFDNCYHLLFFVYNVYSTTFKQNGELYAVCSTAHSKGLITLISDKLKAKSSVIQKDANGRYRYQTINKCYFVNNVLYNVSIKKHNKKP